MADKRIIRKCVYRHFKGGRYMVRDFAEHSETGETMVVYASLDGENQGKVYVRPYEMFASEVDRKKYPSVKQKYRFERVNPTTLRDGCLCDECCFDECCSIKERLQEAFATAHDRTVKQLSCSFGLRKEGQ